MSEKIPSPPLALYRRMVRKFRSLSKKDVLNRDRRLQFSLDEYNPENLSSIKLTVTAPSESVAFNLLPRFQTDCSETLLRCRFCKMKRSSVNESYGFTISPLAKVSTGTSLVDNVHINSPAENSGLRIGDRIMSINGKRVDKDTYVEEMVKDKLDVELVVSRMENVPDDQSKECDNFDRKLKNRFSKASSDAKSTDSKPSSSKYKTSYKNPETEDDQAPRITWGTGTILDRYPEARAMLKMLGRGPYSDDFSDYGWSFY